MFLPRLMKLCILVVYKDQSVHFWSCDITKHGVYELTISQPFLKLETSGLEQKSIKLCAEHCTVLGVIECISSHVTAH